MEYARIDSRVQRLSDLLGIRIHTFLEIQCMGVIPMCSYYFVANGVYEASKDVIGLNECKLNTDMNSVALHEIIHWTGHPSRLNRPFIANCTKSVYYDNYYSRSTEEATAQLGMFYLAEALDLHIDAKQLLDQYLACYPSADLTKAAKDARDAANWILEQAYGSKAA